MTLDNISSVTNMDLFVRSRSPLEVMVRPRRDEYERVSTIGARRTIPDIDPMHPDMTRATFIVNVRI